LRQK